MNAQEVVVDSQYLVGTTLNPAVVKIFPCSQLESTIPASLTILRIRVVLLHKDGILKKELNIGQAKCNVAPRPVCTGTEYGN